MRLVLDIDKIDDFVRALIAAPMAEGQMKKFVEEVGMDIDLKFALEQAQPTIAATALRMCAIRAFGSLDQLPKKLHKSLKGIGVLSG